MTPEGPADVTLSDLWSKATTVILFIPAAFSGVCTTELCDMTAGVGRFNSLNAQVVCISGDTFHAQAAWAKQNGITIPLLSDLGKQAIEGFDVLLPNFAGMNGAASLRAVFIVDTSGVIRYVQVTPTPGDLPDFDAVAEALEAMASAAV